MRSRSSVLWRMHHCRPQLPLIGSSSWILIPSPLATFCAASWGLLDVVYQWWTPGMWCQRGDENAKEKTASCIINQGHSLPVNAPQGWCIFWQCTMWAGTVLLHCTIKKVSVFWPFILKYLKEWIILQQGFWSSSKNCLHANVAESI